MTNEKQEFPLLKKQNILLGKWLALINVILICACLLIASTMKLLKMDVLTPFPGILFAIAIVCIVLLTVANYYMFGKYLLNFDGDEIRRFINLMSAGLITALVALPVSLYATNEGVRIGAIILLIIGLVTWVIVRMMLPRVLYNEIDDYVGGIQEGVYVKWRLGWEYRDKYLIYIMPYYIYSVFSCAHYYVREYGFEE